MSTCLRDGKHGCSAFVGLNGAGDELIRIPAPFPYADDVPVPEMALVRQEAALLAR
jgi:hypothetical protein